MITGINHITLAISDLNRSFAFYRDILSMKPLAKWKTGAYLLCGETWVCLSYDECTRSTPIAEYTHIALHCDPTNFSEIRQRLKAAGAKIWKENSSEGDSIYFLDPDHHKLEIHATTRQDRIRATKEKPYVDMEFFV